MTRILSDTKLSVWLDFYNSRGPSMSVPQVKLGHQSVWTNEPKLEAGELCNVSTTTTPSHVFPSAQYYFKSFKY